MKVKVVVGANYGDEGKGLLTEHLCRLSSKPLVVLANGGCQRGHTVDNPEFGRHVFQHFGSGTFVGADTYFAAEYKLNPMQFIKEYDELEKMLNGKPMPTIYAHENSPFQFPVDIFLNRFVEKLRGKNRHGSVGAGIWETCLRHDYLRQRSNNTAISLYSFVSRYASIDWLVDQLKYWSEEYYNHRIEELANKEFNISVKELKTLAENDPLYPVFFSNGMYEHFAKDCKAMFKKLKWLSYHELTKTCDTLIFEQGQGLCLDQEYCDDPRYATPSSPGLASVVPIVSNPTVFKNGLEEIVVEYVTRSYLTRHGAGPFPEEDKTMKFPDKTNMPNDWQGTLRFGKFDIDSTYEMFNRINRDVSFFKQLCMYDLWTSASENGSADGVQLHSTLTVTHCNEVPPNKLFARHATRFSYSDDSRKMLPNSLWKNSFIDNKLINI